MEKMNVTEIHVINGTVEVKKKESFSYTVFKFFVQGQKTKYSGMISIDATGIIQGAPSNKINDVDCKTIEVEEGAEQNQYGSYKFRLKGSGKKGGGGKFGGIKGYEGPRLLPDEYLTAIENIYSTILSVISREAANNQLPPNTESFIAAAQSLTSTALIAARDNILNLEPFIAKKPQEPPVAQSSQQAIQEKMKEITTLVETKKIHAGTLCLFLKKIFDKTEIKKSDRLLLATYTLGKFDIDNLPKSTLDEANEIIQAGKDASE